MYLPPYKILRVYTLYFALLKNFCPHFIKLTNAHAGMSGVVNVTPGICSARTF
jgi:hypothetical protein